MATTERLEIEQLCHDHAAGLVAALGDPQVGAYLGGPDVSTEAAMHDRIDRLAEGPGPGHPDERWHNFAVRRVPDGAVLGRIEATTYGDWAEIAYVFGPATWGQGYATEATQWLLVWLHDRGVTELWAAVHPDNNRSVRLLLRLGFEQLAVPTRPLGSFDDGDLVFRSAAAATARSSG